MATAPPQKYDDVLRRVGEFGHFQKLQYALVCIVGLTVGMHSYNMVFVAAIPQHRCKIFNIPPQWENLTQREQRTLSIPKTETGDFDSCKMYNLSEVDWMQGSITDWLHHGNHSTTDCIDGWEYDTDTYISTIVSEWDMVCQNAWQKSMASSIFFAGRFAGSLLGQVADRFGRRHVFFICAICQVVVGCSAAFSPHPYFFYVTYFLQGFLQMGVQVSCFVLGLEAVGPKYRGLLGLSWKIFNAASQMLLAGIAFGIQRWRWIEVTISLISLIYLFYYWLMPESVRWLISIGRMEEADRIVTKMCKMNKVQLDKDILKDIKKEGKVETFSLLDIFRHWHTAKLTLIIWFNGLATSLVFYGVVLNMSNVAGDPYINFFISGVVELPGLLLGIILLERCGRRRTYIAYLLLAGVACISSAFVPRAMTWLATLLVMVGKLCIAGAFAIMQIVSAEVFPTVIRNVGLSSSSAIARGAGMIAPQILLLEMIAPYLPLTVLGCVAVVAAGLGLMLKETAGDLPERFDDMYTSFSNDITSQISVFTTMGETTDIPECQHVQDDLQERF